MRASSSLRTGGEGLLAVALGRGFLSVFSVVFLYFGGWPSNKTNGYIIKGTDVIFLVFNISNHYFDWLNKLLQTSNAQKKKCQQVTFTT